MDSELLNGSEWFATVRNGNGSEQSKTVQNIWENLRTFQISLCVRFIIGPGTRCCDVCKMFLFSLARSLHSLHSNSPFEFSLFAFGGVQSSGSLNELFAFKYIAQLNLTLFSLLAHFYKSLGASSSSSLLVEFRLTLKNSVTE